MWRIHDAARMNRRRVHLQLANSIYEAQLALERKIDLRPVFDLSKYNTLGGHTGRAMLVSWILEESSALHLTLSTACLSVSLWERVLGKRQVSLRRSQSYAACCLLIAMKMEETGGDAMEIPERLQAHVSVWLEIEVARALQWKLIAPTVYTFLCIFAKRVWLPPSARACAERYLKSVLLHCDSQLFYPSSLALICILFAERDGLLPDVCKHLTLKAVRESKSRAEEVAHGFRLFRLKCPSPLEVVAVCDAGKLDNESDECGVGSGFNRRDVGAVGSSCDSSTTAYAGSRSTSSSSGRELPS